MAYECFDVDQQDHVAHIILKRPEKRNSMIPAFWRELPALVEELDGSGEVRAIVVSSTGPHFTSGMDLSVFASAADTDSDKANGAKDDHAAIAARFYQTIKKLQHCFSSLESARMPVLAAVQGGCIGAGVDMITACDMRYATEDAFFIIQETNLAMTADVGTFPRLSKLIPDGIVRELAYTGRALTGPEAYEFGLVNQLYPDSDTLLDAVMDIAFEIAEKSPTTIYGCKKMILHARDHTVADTLDYVGLWNASFFDPAQIAEAMNAQREDRPATFRSLPAHPADDDDLQL